jgi:hypothetical protein
VRPSLVLYTRSPTPVTILIVAHHAAPASQAECYAISESRHKWLELVVASYEHDSAAQDMITKHAVDGDSVPHFALINGLLRYKGRVWIGSHQDLHLKITAPMHDSALGGGGALRSPSGI